MNRFLLITGFTIVLVFLLIKLLLHFYTDQLLNLSELDKSKSEISIKDDVLNQITNSSGDSTIIVLNIWESWCRPCIKEIPELNKLSESFKDYNIRFIAISSSSEFDCNKVLKENNIEFHYETFFERKELIWQIDSIYYNSPTKKIVVPQNIIISSKGKIVMFLVGAKPENVLKMKLYLVESAKKAK